VVVVVVVEVVEAVIWQMVSGTTEPNLTGVPG
jgi:hypothetical protein